MAAATLPCALPIPWMLPMARRLPALLRPLAAWLAGVIVAALLGSVSQSLGALRAIEGLGASISLADVFGTIAHDFVHFAPVWGAVVAVAFALALPVAAWLARRRVAWRVPLYALAGAVAVLTILLAMQASMGLMPIASARSLLGVAGFVLGGALGALACERVLSRRPATLA
jgi:peptidoglycan/LPS O-acetylase OafA/YrhL